MASWPICFTCTSSIASMTAPSACVEAIAEALPWWVLVLELLASLSLLLILLPLILIHSKLAKFLASSLFELFQVLDASQHDLRRWLSSRSQILALACQKQLWFHPCWVCFMLSSSIIYMEHLIMLELRHWNLITSFLKG